MISCSLLATASDTRTGDSGNQPATGFSEGAEVIEIFNHTTGVHDTDFDIDENVTIRVTSNVVTTLPTANKNYVELFDYQGNSLAQLQGFFAIESAGPPTVLNGTFQLSAANGITEDGDYLLEIRLHDGGNKFFFFDVIHVGGATYPEERYIKLFSNAGYSSESYLFSPLDTVYVEVWAGADQPDNTTSTVSVADFAGGGTGAIPISTLANQNIVKNGNYSRFSVSLPGDIGAQMTFDNDYWYTLSTTQNDGAVNQVVDWSVQFKVNISGITNPPSITAGALEALPSPIYTGTETTTLAANFTHPDSPLVNNLRVTFAVQSESNTEYLLVDNRQNGQGGLTITQDGGDSTLYRATYTWAPPVDQEPGLYDLRFRVFDGLNQAVDGYGDNTDELELLNASVPVPRIDLGWTRADPSTCIVWGDNTTTLMVNFTYANTSLADTFLITFRVRNPLNDPPITLVNAATHGTSGVNVTEPSAGHYLATYVWNPPDDYPLGAYDLFSRVEDGAGMFDEDDFGDNQDELVLVNYTVDIQIGAGNTTCTPDFINRTGTETTELKCPFFHSLAPAVGTLEVSFLVRGPDGTVYSLVQEKKHGTANVEVTSLGDKNYSASYAWDPPEDQPTGTYDLYFSVKDAAGFVAVDSYDSNLEELTIDRKPFEPNAVKGALTAIPDTVDVLAAETTLINLSFYHGEMPVVDSFEITLSVRDVNDTEYVLVDKGKNGDANLKMVTDGDGNFTASFAWTPPKNQTLGAYDLQMKITDFNSREIEDVYADNLDELTLVAVPPADDDDDVDDDVVDENNGTIEGKIEDEDGDPIEGATITIYDDNGNEVATVATDENGEFLVELPPGTYDLIISADGYLNRMEKGVLVEKGKATDLDLDLEAEPSGDDDVDDDDDDDDDGLSGLFIGIIVVLIILVLLVVIGVLAFLLLRKKKDDEEPEEEKEAGGLPEPTDGEAAGPVGPPLPEDMTGMPGGEAAPGEPGPPTDEGMPGGEEPPADEPTTGLDDLEDMPDIDEEVPELEESWPDENGGLDGSEQNNLEEAPNQPTKK